MIDVYAWPPVGVVGSEWTVSDPVARLRSGLTGRDQMQASQRRRRIASLEVSALACGRMGAGYMEMLKDLLRGGIHAVRLRSSPINWHLDEMSRRDRMGGTPFEWVSSEGDFTWQNAGMTFSWFAEAHANGGVPVMQDGWCMLPVTALPPIFTVARPGDFIRVHSATTSASQTARVLRPAITNAAGEVVLRLDRPITISGGRVNMVAQDEGVFRVEGELPRAMQPTGANWSYSWTFREVFADEVDGFTERNPWI